MSSASDNDVPQPPATSHPPSSTAPVLQPGPPSEPASTSATPRVWPALFWIIKESVAVGLGVLLGTPFARAFTAFGLSAELAVYALIALGLVLLLLSFARIPVSQDGRAPSLFVAIGNRLGRPPVGSHPATLCFAVAAIILLVRREGWVDPCGGYAVVIQRAVAQPTDQGAEYVPLVISGTAAQATDPTKQTLWLGSSYTSNDSIRVYSQISPGRAGTWEATPVSISWGQTVRYRVLLADPYAALLFHDLVRNGEALRYPQLPVANLQGVTECADQEFIAPSKPTASASPEPLG